MSSPFYNVQAQIIDVIKDNLSINDDAAAPLTGVVGGEWYNESIFGGNAYQVTVGDFEVYGSDFDVGMFRLLEYGTVTINVWVLEKDRSAGAALTYTPQRVVSQLCVEIKKVLWKAEAGRKLDLHMKTGAWTKMDEEETYILRRQIVVDVMVEEYRTDGDVIS